jgi:ribosomal protein L24
MKDVYVELGQYVLIKCGVFAGHFGKILAVNLEEKECTISIVNENGSLLSVKKRKQNNYFPVVIKKCCLLFLPLSTNALVENENVTTETETPILPIQQVEVEIKPSQDNDNEMITSETTQKEIIETELNLDSLVENFSKDIDERDFYLELRKWANNIADNKFNINFFCIKAPTPTLLPPQTLAPSASLEKNESMDETSKSRLILNLQK